MMMLQRLALLASTAMAGLINGLPTNTSLHPSLPEGYELAPITWSIPITPGVQEVTHSIKTMRLAAGLPADFKTAETHGTQLSAVDNDAFHVLCNVGLSQGANRKTIETEGIPYLEGLGGYCGMMGNKRCNRVSCSYQSAIYWCNDNSGDDEGYFYTECSNFGHLARKVMDECGSDYGLYDSVYPEVWGQVFDDDHNFNVMVGYDKHC
ncbi:hypothetical protein F5Y15DRAFT_412903 [Xylariaceae sp. FL0016]|nr:hypothetical protein F5Y15DRAFT_412903 [Xylariaceae sp. FL0016]